MAADTVRFSMIATDMVPLSVIPAKMRPPIYGGQPLGDANPIAERVITRTYQIIVLNGEKREPDKPNAQPSRTPPAAHDPNSRVRPYQNRLRG